MDDGPAAKRPGLPFPILKREPALLWQRTLLCDYLTVPPFFFVSLGGAPKSLSAGSATKHA